MRCLAMLAACCVLPTLAVAECKFLNEDCKEGNYQTQDATPPRELTEAEHLERCLADYIADGGRFMPEGKSVRGGMKSKSDMTAMCTFAIRNHNYYWDHPKNRDEQANFSCCLKMTDQKTCADNFKAAKEAQTEFDWCSALAKLHDPPPKEWNVPAGCVSGPCLVTPGYCNYVGYRRSDPAARAMIRSFKAQLPKYNKETREHTIAVLRVCYGVR